MQMMHVLHKLTLSTSNLVEGAKDVHWCKETAFYVICYFIEFVYILFLRERNQARFELFSEIF